MTGGFCPTSGKMMFGSQVAAKRHFAHIKMEMAVYFCRHCESWHATSRRQRNSKFSAPGSAADGLRGRDSSHAPGARPRSGSSSSERRLDLLGDWTLGFLDAEEW